MLTLIVNKGASKNVISPHQRHQAKALSESRTAMLRYATLCDAMRPYISLATENIEIPIPRPKVFSSWCPGITFTAKNGADPILLLGKMADPNGSNSAPPRIQFFTLVFAADPILTRF